ncbi:MAG: type II and III secretion system protein [Phycisphaerae bacterium]|nr:type II and III secretion system protein [Phycisphaerae bacterium]
MRNTVRSDGKSAAALLRGVVFRGALCAFAFVCISGCGDFFESKPTELESQRTLRELNKVQLSPNANIPVPSVYKEPPKIVEGTIGEKTDAKLFYFSRYHRVEKLKALIDNQFIKKFFDAKGKPTVVVDYNCSINPATNQLVVRCPTVIDAEQVLSFLEKVDVPPIQVKIDCIISEIYADHTLDWETRLEVQNLFGQEINLVGKLPGAALRDIARSTFGLQAGYVDGGTYNAATDTFTADKQGHMFGALVDVLVSRGYLKILMNPQLEVVNGESATIVTSEHVPLDFIQSVHPVSGVITQKTEYVDVVDSLTITPHVFADGYIGIETRAVIGSKATPEGVKQVPIVTKREVVIKENRIRSGESLVIGGIRKAEQRSVVRGVPGLKDIPILGVLFSSKDFEERAKEVLFILTPTISTGGMPNEEMVANIQRKHTRIKTGDSLLDNIKDPFGSGAYTELVEEEAIRTEVERIKAEMEKAAAERKAADLTIRLDQAIKQAEQEKQRASRATSEIQAKADEAQTTVDAARAEAEQAKAAAAAAQKLLEEEKTRAAAAKAENEKALADANKTAAEAAAAKAAADKAKADADAEKAAAEKARKDAEERIAEWMKAAKEKLEKQKAEEEARKKETDDRTGP